MIEKNTLIDFILQNNKEMIHEHIEDIHPVDFLEALEDYDENPMFILENLPDEYIGLLLDYAEDENKIKIISLFTDKRKGEILSEMSSDELVDMLGTLGEDDKNAMITSMNVEDAKEVTELLTYDPETAGGIMATEFIAIKETFTVSQLPIT